VGTLVVAGALFFGADFLAAGFFAAVLLMDVIFPAFELPRTLLEELAFFIARQSACRDGACKSDCRSAIPAIAQKSGHPSLGEQPCGV
jgi:hypothetical protein